MFPGAKVLDLFAMHFFKNKTDLQNSNFLNEVCYIIYAYISTLYVHLLHFNIVMVNQVCAVGWEPNPGLAKYLNKLEESYQRCGWRVKIHTSTGVGVENSWQKFVRMEQDPYAGWDWENEMASQFVSDEQLQTNYYLKDREAENIKVIRIAEYINTVVATRYENKKTVTCYVTIYFFLFNPRYIPPGRQGSVIMKLDVEGLEVRTGY